MNQLIKLEKVLALYEQQLAVIKTNFKKQALIVAEKRQLATDLQQELVITQERSAAAKPEAGTLQMTVCLMQQVENNIQQNQHQIADETGRLELQRLELRKQMAKIEALEKVVANKTKMLEHLKRQTEQHLADERYLNTLFNGSLK